MIDMMTKRHTKRGFSLVELIIVVAVMAAISAIIIPSISGTTEAAREQSAIAAAESLNMAQMQMRMRVGPEGWNAANDSACDAAVAPYLEYAETWANFQARHAGYTFDFQPLDNGHMQRVILKRGATTIDY